MFEQMTIDEFLPRVPKRLNVLLACEESQAVCIEFRKLGHRAFSCDIQECSGGHPEWHIMGDALKLISKDCKSFTTMDGCTHTHTKWDMIIAFPPCTHLAVIGDNARKTTCFWLKGIDPLEPEVTEEPELEFFEWICKKTGRKKRQPLWYYKAYESDDRGKTRSKTFLGVARAMAAQWGGDCR